VPAFLSVVVLIVQIEDFSFRGVNPERDPPVPGDAETPGPFSAAGKLVRFPTRDVAEFLDVLNFLQEGKNVADLLDYCWRQPRRIVAFDEAPQPLMDHIPDRHSPRLPPYPHVWQDVYHAVTPVRKDAYIKITFRDLAPVIQFKEK
jgi:hypothetical protein